MMITPFSRVGEDIDTIFSKNVSKLDRILVFFTEKPRVAPGFPIQQPVLVVSRKKRRVPRVSRHVDKEELALLGNGIGSSCQEGFATKEERGRVDVNW